MVVSLGDAQVAAQLLEIGFGEEIAAHGVLQGGEPVHFGGVGDVPGIVQAGVFVGFDDAHGRVVQMAGDPGGIDQIFGVSVSAGHRYFSPSELDTD